MRAVLASIALERCARRRGKKRALFRIGLRRTLRVRLQWRPARIILFARRLLVLHCAVQLALVKRSTSQGRRCQQELG